MAIPTGDIYLLHNVPLTATYEHTIDFKDKDEQFDYLLGFVKRRLTNYTYVRKEREYISVELPMSYLDDINYLIFKSADDERFYFAFITNKQYVSPNASYVFFKIDVMQTYMFDYEWRASYIKQAHVDRWTADHKPIYSKTDEGLDYGTEYSVESAFKIQQSNDIKWLLVSMVDPGELSTKSVSGGTVGQVPTPFICCLMPLPLRSYTGLNGQGANYTVFLDDGQETPLVLGTYEQFIQAFSNSAIGNYVKSATILTYNPFVSSEVIDEENKTITVRLVDGVSYDTFSLQYTPKNTGGTSIGSSSITMLRLVKVPSTMSMGSFILATTNWSNGLENTLPSDAQWEEVKANPYTTKRDKRFESKLLCAPYRYNLLSDWRNSPVVFKNEYMTVDNIQLMFSYAMSYNAPFRFWLKDYKRDPEGRNTSLSQPIGGELPVLSDAYYTYMWENKNTIQANVTNANIQAGAGLAMGIINGAVNGGWAGALMGGLNAGVNGAVNVTSLIRSENAKQGDLKTKPDTMINSVDSSFIVSDGINDISFYRMRICCENEEILGEIFNMSGYTVNRVDVPNTRSRARFNYIQTVGANIVGSFNQADLLEIKEIYNRGITIWHYNANAFNPLDYSYENIEVNLI